MKLKIIIILLLIPLVYGYSLEETQTSGFKTYIYTLEYSEQPLNETLRIGTFYPNEIIINNSYFDNLTNTSVINITYINESRTLVISTGPFVSGPSTLVVENETHLDVEIFLDEETIGIHNSWVEINEDSELLNISPEIKFLINYDSDIFEEEGSYIMQPENNVYNRWVYESSLPAVFTENHRIRTRPNATMFIDCQPYTNNNIEIECSHIQITTTNLTEFTSSVTVPNNIPLGKYRADIMLDTSYNTSGNITIFIDVLETDVVIQEHNITIEKEPENMTAQELRDFLDLLDETTKKRIQELEAANRTKQKTVYVNKTTPFVANADAIALAVAEFYAGHDSNTYVKLLDMVEKYEKEQTLMENKLNNLNIELNTTKASMIDEDELRDRTIKDLNHSIQSNNYIFEKGKILKPFLIILFIIGLPITIYILYKKSWGGAW